MAITRHATGSSRPRQFPVVETTTTTTKKKTTKKPAVKGARVGKAGGAKATPAQHKRKPTVADKVKGAVKKAAGAVERKPAKKAAGTAEMRGHDGKVKHKKV
jgi:hypothetical protein